MVRNAWKAPSNMPFFAEPHEFDEGGVEGNGPNPYNEYVDYDQGGNNDDDN